MALAHSSLLPGHVAAPCLNFSTPSAALVGFGTDQSRKPTLRDAFAVAVLPVIVLIAIRR